MKEQLTQIEVDIFNNIKNSVKGELKDIFVDYMLAAGFSGKDGAPDPIEFIKEKYKITRDNAEETISNTLGVFIKVGKIFSAGNDTSIKEFYNDLMGVDFKVPLEDYDDYFAPSRMENRIHKINKF